MAGSIKGEFKKRILKNKIIGTSQIKKERIVPDTSIIIEGLLSELISKDIIKTKKVIIHKSVIAELEAQANKNREIGFLGLEEIKHIREICDKKSIEIIFEGIRPGEFEIKYAKTGEIDARIRDLARKENATLITADTVQALVAEAEGIEVLLYEFEEKDEEFVLKKFFDENTMSVHIKEGIVPRAKVGRPNEWVFIDLPFPAFERDEIKKLAKRILEQTEKREDGFVEIDRSGSTILQVGTYRIVITRPPFSETYEITAVRPIKILSLEEYGLDQRILERLEKSAEGILIAGSPGQGKTTFAQALAKYYSEKGKIVKTIEAPRDLVVPKNVTQYALSYGTSQEIKDILLLSRPDYTIFDEMRNTSDFHLFSDLRLSGVGMIGVIHATQPIDAIQRFVRRVELGVIPHIVDTVIFIEGGKIKKVLGLNIEVKVPSGMTEEDLARPVVVVNDFLTGKPEYEIYTYGDEAVVVPVKTIPSEKGVYTIAKRFIKEKMKRYASHIDISFLSPERALVRVPESAIPNIIGKQGKNIDKLEKEIGIKITVEPFTKNDNRFVEYKINKMKKTIHIILGKKYANMEIGIVINGNIETYMFVSKKGEIKIKKDSDLGRKILDALKEENLKIVLV